MALFVLRLPPPPLSPHPPNPNPNPNPNPRRRCPSLHLRTFPLPRPPWRGATAPRSSLGSAPSPSPSPSLDGDALRRGAAALVLHLAASIFVLLGFGARASALASATPPLQSPPPAAAAAAASETDHAVENSDTPQAAEDEEWRAAFDAWKAKTYELTVPLRIVALRGSIPPSWTKDFIQAQGRRLKLIPEYRGSLDSIFYELCSASEKGRVQLKSAMASDVVSIGDSWLSYAIRRGLIEPIKDAEEQDWFRNLSEKWKVYLCRNSKGELDSSGDIWGAPYRWGTMVIAYKKSKFRKHNLKPIEDWEDLWRPELAGKIAMVDSPREVVGAVLKRLGASYNTKDIDSQVNGGREEVFKSLRALQRQVRLFDSACYLKSFGIGDVWVAVGWSSDVIPAAKRMSNVAVIVPKSGTSLWADLWAIPYAAKFDTDQIGGRVRGPSPLIHQWFEFCLQTARALPFRQEVVPGSSPCTVEHPQLEGPREPDRGKPKLDTNLVGGVPPAETLAKCEFLEPLSDKALADHQWLISNTVNRDVV